LFVVHADDLRLAVGDECFVFGFGEECHLRGSLCSRTPFWSGHKDPGPKRTAARNDRHSSPFERYCRARKATDVTAALRWRGPAQTNQVERS
jgi:hypothetical protein